MRDDGILYTGSNRASKDIAQLRKEERKAKEIQRSKLLPVSEVVISELDKEKKSTELGMLKLIPLNSKEADVRVILNSLKLYGESIDNLKTRFNNMLRDNKVVDDRENNG